MASYLDQVAIGTLYITGNNHGWSERYNIRTASTVNLANGQTEFAKFVKFRQLIMAREYSMVWARVTMGDTARLRLRAIDSPLAAVALSSESSDIQGSNDVKSCLHLAIETANGNFSNRFFRGIRDSWFVESAMTFIPTVPGTVAPGTDDVSGLTAAVACGNFIRALMQYTWHVKNNAGVPAFTNWASYTVRGVTARDTGRPFGCGRGRRPAVREE